MSVAKVSATKPVVLDFHAAKNALLIAKGPLHATGAAPYQMQPLLSPAIAPKVQFPGWAAQDGSAEGSADLDTHYAQQVSSMNYQV